MALLSPNKLKSWSKEVGFKNESIWARVMVGVLRPDVRQVKDVSVVYGVKGV